MTTPESTSGWDEDILIWPTVLVQIEVARDRMAFVTAGPGSEDEALIVFRNPGDAAAFQEKTGRFTEEEGFERLVMDHPGIANILEMQGIPNVVMPMSWSGNPEARVPMFAGEDFIELLEESEPAC